MADLTPSQYAARNATWAQKWQNNWMMELIATMSGRPEVPPLFKLATELGATPSSVPVAFANPWYWWKPKKARESSSASSPQYSTRNPPQETGMFSALSCKSLPRGLPEFLCALISRTNSATLSIAIQEWFRDTL
eukprot:4466762-Amphidinium_carterae.1